MKRLAIIGLFPGICLGVAFLCIDSARMSQESAFLSDLNQAVEAGADIKPDMPQEAANMAAVASSPAPEEQQQQQPSEELAMSVEEPAPVEEMSPEAQVQTPVVPAESKPEEMTPVTPANSEALINKYVDEIGALVAQQLADKVYLMMQERLQGRLKTFIQKELVQIMQACPINTPDSEIQEDVVIEKMQVKSAE